VTSLTAERWRLHGGELPAASAVGAAPGGQEQGSKISLPSQRLVLRTVGSENVEGLDFAAVAALIKDAGSWLYSSFSIQSCNAIGTIAKRSR
jgi:hypothetical protein